MKDNKGVGLTEGRGGFLGLLYVLTRVGREPWCGRGPRRDLVAVIYQCADTHTGKIGGLARICVGLHTLHSRLLRTALEYHDGYRSDGRGGAHVPRFPLQTALQTAFGHHKCILKVE